MPSAGSTTSLSSAGLLSSFQVSLAKLDIFVITILTTFSVIYFFWPETARLTLEEIAKNFGDEVAVNLTDATEEEKAELDQRIIANGDEKELKA